MPLSCSPWRLLWWPDAVVKKTSTITLPPYWLSLCHAFSQHAFSPLAGVFFFLGFVDRLWCFRDNRRLGMFTIWFSLAHPLVKFSFVLTTERIWKLFSPWILWGMHFLRFLVYFYLNSPGFISSLTNLLNLSLRLEVFFILQTDDGKWRMMLCMGLLQTHLDDYDDTNLFNEFFMCAIFPTSPGLFDLSSRLSASFLLLAFHFSLLGRKWSSFLASVGSSDPPWLCFRETIWW